MLGGLDPILDRVWFVDEPHKKDISCSADDTSDDQCEEDNTHKADREVIHVDIDDWEGFEERVLKGEGHISASSFRNKVTSRPRSLHKCRYISAVYTLIKATDGSWKVTLNGVIRYRAMSSRRCKSPCLISDCERRS